MQNMFSASPWFNTKQGGIPGLGFTPGPVQVPLVNAMPGQGFGVVPTFGAPAPVVRMAAPAASMPAVAPPPAPRAPAAPQGSIPMGKKADCPVCRSFGSGF